jgi:hypothetical protein
MSANISTRLVSFDKQIECHQAALPALELSKKYDYLGGESSLTNELLQAMNKLKPVQCIHENEVFYYFANWHFIDTFQSRKIQKVYVSIHSTLGDADIENLSYAHLLFDLLSIPKQHQLGICSSLVAELHPAFVKELVGENYSYSASRVVEKITQSNRNTIANQLKKLDVPENNISESKLSVLDRLLTK